MRRRGTRGVGWGLAMALCLLVAPGAAAQTDLRFNRDIRPILSDKCIFCHGPDPGENPSKLRLDSREAATADLGGYRAVVPGSLEESVLWRRINATAPAEKMPPPDSHKKLEPGEVDLLRQWILAGAPWEGHWSYTPLERPAPPVVSQGDWPANDVDRFTLAAMEAAGRAPSAEADRVTLVRRVSLDLTGLFPTPEEVAAFLEDGAPGAWERLVDRLLASPRYGERMAVMWLDLVRYADSIGYHSDNPMPVSPYREYVVNAFNGNLPFDQFTREQLAGDLLENPEERQLVASAYNRLNQKTEEGGAQAKEYRAIMQADRVRNVSEVWLAATMGCAQCHDHKYDPLSMKDFYRLGAFFADLDEPDIYHGGSAQGATLTLMDPDARARLAELKEQLGPLREAVEGAAPEADAAQAAWEEQARAALAEGTEAPWVDALDEAHRAILAKPAGERSEDEAKQLRAFFRERTPLLAEARAARDAAAAEAAALEAGADEVLISRAVEPREVRVLPRGNWMDDSGAVVTPAVPAAFGSLDTGDRRATRLDLANWICDEENPLTARVFVNRVWQLLFGRGISVEAGDFGGQGAYPANPELLDYLAAYFLDHGWDVKGLVRHIALSATYRQESRPGPGLREADPANDLFARQGRFRVEAEFVRDNALALSGLLVEGVSRRSAKPYQPAGYYAQLNFPKRTYEADTNDGQYRRGLYTHWQRTFPHPMLKAFDAPSREECTARRSRSNTPLQSLALLNDPSFVEAARVFAERMSREGGADPESRIRWAYETALSRAPDARVAAQLLSVYNTHLKHYTDRPDEAAALLGVGLAPCPEDLDPVQLASQASVARVILNLHETITRY